MTLKADSSHVSFQREMPQLERYVIHNPPLAQDHLAADISYVILQGELPQLEQHVIHNPELAQHIPRWQPYKALSITLEVGQSLLQ